MHTVHPLRLVCKIHRFHKIFVRVRARAQTHTQNKMATTKGKF